MRDIILTAVVFGLLPVILARAHVGIYVWSWIGYMNPHRLAWGFAYNFPFAAVVGLVTIIAILLSREPKRIPWSATTFIWAAFVIWMTITTLGASFPDLAWAQWDKVIKIQLMILLTLMMINSRERINMLIWVIVASIGFYGVKGGVFAAATGGRYRVWGPEGSFIYDNNQLALALVMVLPLMYYLRLQSDNKWVRLALLGAMVLCALSILSSWSRGAFLAIAVIGLFLWLRSRKRLLGLLFLVITVPVAWSFMPDEWNQRMGTIETYQDDASAMGRIYAWTMAGHIARDYPLGGGFGTFHQREFHDHYTMRITGDPNTYIATDAHSIYFLVLGDHGFIGLALFLILWISAFLAGYRILRMTKGRDDLKWAADLASMTQVSLVGYAVGGAFLGLSYFDLYYHLIALMIITAAITVRTLQSGPETTVATEPEPEPVYGPGATRRRDKAEA